MNKRSIWSLAVVLLGTLALLAGCQSGGSGGGSGSGDGKEVSFKFDMPYHLQSVGAGGGGALIAGFSASDVMTGELVATNTDTLAVQTFDWSIYLDEVTLDVQSNKTIILDPGTYDFALLVSQGDHSYAGEALAVSIVDGENDVPLTIRPIIGDVTTNVNVVSRLIDLRFEYLAAEFAGAGISNPRIGITVDGGMEQIFDVDSVSGLSEYMMLNLSPGAHTFELRLLDGALQRGKSLDAQEAVVLSPGVDVHMDLVALHGEVVLSLDVEGGDATFNFTIPAEVVDEAGGVGDLQVQLHLTSDETSQDIEEVLTLSPSGGNYSASVTHSGFQFEVVTIALNFVDITDDEQLGFCAHAVTLTTSEQSAACDVTLRRRAEIGGNLLATLGVNVFTDGVPEPVSGAEVYVDGNLVGVTGSGMFGTAGYLKIFAVSGEHDVRATTSSAAGEITVTLDPLGIHNEDIVLDMALGAACFSMTNTSGEDLTGNNWFDACVDAVGSTVRVVLKDGGGTIVYDAMGAKVGTWDYDNVTSSAYNWYCGFGICNDQYNPAVHNRAITLDNGDTLIIPSRSAANAGCHGSLGDGYSIEIYPASPAFGFPRMLVMPYRQMYYSAGTPRYFSGWSPSHEISWGGGGEFNTCGGMTGTERPAYTFEFYVE